MPAEIADQAAIADWDLNLAQACFNTGLSVRHEETAINDFAWAHAKSIGHQDEALGNCSLLVVSPTVYDLSVHIVIFARPPPHSLCASTMFADHTPSPFAVWTSIYEQLLPDVDQLGAHHVA